MHKNIEDKKPWWFGLNSGMTSTISDEYSKKFDEICSTYQQIGTRITDAIADYIALLANANKNKK
ncbi:MAG: hypothetical protein QW051_01740 [Candidatus Aenigmatarchaeota archaeon]